jgi:molybdenum cofactor cytidylyltransferase
MIGGVVLAAGAGKRFGGVKQLAELGGRPLLEHVLEHASQAPLDSVVVVLGANAARITGEVDLHGAEPVVCDDWRHGMGASLNCGLGALNQAAAVVVLLGDQPLIGAPAIQRVLSARGGGAEAIRATYGGQPGHPVVLERRLFARLRELRGDVGARDILAGAAVREIACDGIAQPADVDTRANLQAVEESFGD